MSYGKAIVAALSSNAHFVIDTSRNGRGPAAGGVWCNPPGRGLGTPPSASTGDPAADAFLWVKHPGASDGTCNGGPAAGTWWPAAALELASNSVG
jgi:endoglucanase